jgi:leader peptidase (prepilin peptidase) / N-methyltransferase
MLLEAVVALLLGLVIGSFLNVCIYRMPRDLSVVAPRSYCPECEHPIAWYDNIPLASYAVLRGRCRHCRKPIPARYPAVELLTGALFFVLVLKFGPSLVALKMCVFSALIVGLVFSDVETKILPDEFTLGGVGLGILFAAMLPLHDPYLDWFLGRWFAPGVVFSVVEAVMSAALPSLLLWGLGVLFLLIRKKEGLGLGDVKMIAMVGAFSGVTGAIFTVMIGSILGSVIGLIYIYATGKDAGSYELPFAVFLGAAALAVPYLVPGLR